MQFLARPHFHSSDGWSTDGGVRVCHPVWEMPKSLATCLWPLIICVPTDTTTKEYFFSFSFIKKLLVFSVFG